MAANRPIPARPLPREFRLTTAADLAGAPAGARPPAAPADDLDAFQPGVPVLHPEYGIGRIVAIDGAGPEPQGAGRVHRSAARRRSSSPSLRSDRWAMTGEVSDIPGRDGRVRLDSQSPALKILKASSREELQSCHAWE